MTETSWRKDEYTGDHVCDLGMLYLRVAADARKLNGIEFRGVLTQAGDWVIFWRNGHVCGYNCDTEVAKQEALDAARTLVRDLDVYINTKNVSL